MNLHLEKCAPPATGKPSAIDWRAARLMAAEAMRWSAWIALLWFLALGIGLSAADQIDWYELPIREIRAWAWEVTR